MQKALCPVCRFVCRLEYCPVGRVLGSFRPGTNVSFAIRVQCSTHQMSSLRQHTQTHPNTRIYTITLQIIRLWKVAHCCDVFGFCCLGRSLINRSLSVVSGMKGGMKMVSVVCGPFTNQSWIACSMLSLFFLLIHFVSLCSINFVKRNNNTLRFELLHKEGPIRNSKHSHRLLNCVIEQLLFLQRFQDISPESVAGNTLYPLNFLHHLFCNFKTKKT